MITKVESLKTLVVSAARGDSIDQLIDLIEDVEKGKVVQVTQIGTGASIEMMAAQRKEFQIKEGPLGVARLLAESGMFYMVQILVDGTEKYDREIKKHQRAIEADAKRKEAELKVSDAKAKLAAADALREQLRKADVAANEAAIEAGLKKAVKEAKEDKE